MSESGSQSVNTGPPSNNKAKAVAAVVIIALIGIVVGAGSLAKSDKTASTTTPSPQASSSPESESSASPSSSTTAKSEYKDGTYTASGQYRTPQSTESVGVKLTLADGVVTAASVDIQAVAPQSREYQSMFVENYKPFVVGKDISSLALDKVAGSSLTPNGFNAALEQIKAEAKSS